MVVIKGVYFLRIFSIFYSEKMACAESVGLKEGGRGREGGAEGKR